MDFDLNDVSLFVHTVRAGSFAAAARKLGMPPNTVSRRVQQLEEKLQTRLLQRSTRKLSLTPTGRQFFDGCVASIDDIERTRMEVLDAGLEPKGTIRVAAPADFFSHFDIDAISRFHERYPLVRLDFVLSDARTDLIEEAIDVAFRVGPTQDLSLVARRLADTHRLLVATPAYLQKHGEPSVIEDLERHECIGTPIVGDRTPWHLEGQEGAREVLVSGRFRASTEHSQRQAVRAGLGIALLPYSGVAEDLASGRLVNVLPAYRHDQGGVWAVYPSKRHLSLAAKALTEFVVEEIARMTTA
ncbi:Transcriptional regulator, LysR family [plant metagenome]|uniref:Transcriptional regulator, LysR family n=1 Tax=plant metagenome TaxID=1297885 RepID=A0A484SHF4_9ZZZZ